MKILILLKWQIGKFFFNKLMGMVHRHNSGNRSSGMGKAHTLEFEDIKKLYDDQKGNDVIELSISLSFVETWINLMFEELFMHNSSITKRQAKVLNRLYESIFNEYNEAFLNNYLRFQSID